MKIKKFISEDDDSKRAVMDAWKGKILAKYPKAKFIDGYQANEDDIYAIVGTFVDRTTGGQVYENAQVRKDLSTAVLDDILPTTLTTEEYRQIISHMWINKDPMNRASLKAAVKAIKEK